MADISLFAPKKFDVHQARLPFVQRRVSFGRRLNRGGQVKASRACLEELDFLTASTGASTAFPFFSSQVSLFVPVRRFRFG
jgi:hypothetical protein